MALQNLTEGPRALRAVLSEDPYGRSRDAVTLAGGAGVVEPGTVLGRVTVSGKYVPHEPTGEDGSETPAAILGYRADTTDGDVEATAIVRDAQVKGPELIHADGADQEAVSAALNSAGIIVR